MAVTLWSQKFLVLASSPSSRGMTLWQSSYGAIGHVTRRGLTVSTHLPRDPFAPIIASNPASSSNNIDSTRNPTIPYIPELFSPDFLSKLLPAQPALPDAPSSAPSNAFMTALHEESKHTRTEKGAQGFATTGSGTLDAFGTLDPNLPKPDVHALLRESWKEDPEMTLRVIWNLRSIHDGKSAKMAFYAAFGWLYAHHPRTAIYNLRALVDRVIELPGGKKGTSEGEAHVPKLASHGYYKDLLNILLLAVKDELTNPHHPFTALNIKIPHGQGLRFKRVLRKRDKERLREKLGVDAYRAFAASKALEVNQCKKEKAAVARRRGREESFRRLSRKLKSDVKFRALYIAVARIFAEDLAADHRRVRALVEHAATAEERKKMEWELTLAPKWAPSLNLAHDKQTNIATAIAMVMYHNGEMGKWLGDVDVSKGALGVDGVKKLRGLYRRWYVRPMRTYLDIPEVLMSTNKWDQINYPRVPSLCFHNNKEHFFKHDEERLVKFLRDVCVGKQKISGATIAPHVLVQSARTYVNNTQTTAFDRRLKEVEMEVVTAQWNSMVDRLRAAGTLDNSMAICDVSGSMTFSYPNTEVYPLYPALALSLLLAQLTKPPFNNTFITFSERPQIVNLPSGAPLHEHVAIMENSDWGGTTNFNAVFLELLLPMAIKHRLKRDEMIKRLLVFSDMQFDEARYHPSNPSSTFTPGLTPPDPSWETNHELIARAYEQAGYDVPEIVYWNLAGRVAAKPVEKSTPGVALVSGFSGNLLKVFMEEGELRGDPAAVPGAEAEGSVAKMTPEEIMRKTLGKKSFDGLKVID